jgi:hypothetical protein
MTLALDWRPAFGAVRFLVTGVLDDKVMTVKRVAPGGTLQTIRGYPDGTWHTTAGQGFDFETPLGVWVSYAYVDRDKKVVDPINDHPVSIFTETPGRTNGEAWLRDIQEPVLSQPVSVLSTGDEALVARQSILDVAGRRTPYVVWDSRSARQGQLTLVVQNKPTAGVWEDSTRRAKLEALFYSGRPLLFSMCSNLGFANAYIAVDAVTFTRWGDGPAWTVTLDYVEVDNPTGLVVNIPITVTYTTAQQLPPAAKYSDWATVDYFTIATRTEL